MRYFLFLAFVFLFGNFFAQRPSDYAYLTDSFPEKEYVYLEDISDLTISLNKNGEPQVIKTNYHKVYFTSDKAGLYNKDQVSSSYFRRLEKVSAYTLSPNTSKDKYKKYKVKDFDTKETISKDHFYDDNEITTFEHQNLKQGAISYTSSTHEYIDPHFSQQFFFGSGSPILKKEVTVTVDASIELIVDYFNMKESDIVYTKEDKGKKVVHKWLWDDLKPLKSEPSAPHPRHFIPHIVLRIANYTNSAGEKVAVLSSLDDLHSWYQELLSHVKCEDETKLKKVLDELIHEDDDERTKVKKVFNWVQKNVKYIAIEDGLGGFVPRDPDLVMARRYGDCKDMSTLIVNMLRLVDVKAHKVWIGTRDIPYGYTQLPSPATDNHMIAAYFDETNGTYIFLDATDSHVKFGMPTQFIQGKEALIHFGETYEVYKVPVVPAHENRYVDTLVLSLKDDQLIGKGVLLNSGYFSNEYRYSLANASNEKAIKSFVKNLTQKGSNKYRLNDFTIRKSDENIYFTYDFELDNYVHGSEEERYVNLNLDKLFSYFKDYKDDRKYPVEEDFKREFHFYFKFETPEGYKVDFLPENQNFQHEKFSFDLTYNMDGENVIYELRLNQDYLMLEVEEMKSFNEMIKTLKAAYKESIVIIKK